MTTSEREGIVGMVVEGFQSLVRGHSRVEDETARRILEEGVITDRDRDEFIDGEFNRKAGLGPSFKLSPIDPFHALTFVSPHALAQARQEDTRLRQLWQTDLPAFDQELQTHWRNMAQGWGVNLTAPPLPKGK